MLITTVMILSHDLNSISDQSILTESIITVYTAEGSTLNLTFNMTNSEIDVRLNKIYIYHNIDYKNINTKQYAMVLQPKILEFQIINLTTKDTGTYKRRSLSRKQFPKTQQFYNTCRSSHLQCYH